MSAVKRQWTLRQPTKNGIREKLLPLGLTPRTPEYNRAYQAEYRKMFPDDIKFSYQKHYESKPKEHWTQKERLRRAKERAKREALKEVK